MAFALRWFAVRGKQPEQVVADLGLRVTGKRQAFPEAKVTAAALANGWFVVVFNDFDHPLLCREMFTKISERAELVTCDIEEHIMYSAASAWTDGRWVWSIEHDAQEGVKHLEARGSLPPCFEEIQGSQLTKQEFEDEQASKDSVDYVFDIPIEVARDLTGFVHNRLLAEHGAPFQVLEPKPISPFFR